MKLNKIILGAAALFAGTISWAQSVTLHGYNDYTVFGVGQQFAREGTGDWDHTEASAEQGSFYNGRTELNLNAVAANLNFNIGVRLDSSLGEWYNLYYDYNTATAVKYATMFHQANLSASFWNGQIVAYTGKWEEWNCGYIYGGYALGAQNIRDIASRSEGQYFTGIEWIPVFNPLTGFRILAGLPLAPNYLDEDNWNILYKKTKLHAQYRWQKYNIVVNTGWHPGEYYTGVDDDNARTATNTYSKSAFGEAYIQLDFPTLFQYFRFNASYDFRYRDAEATKFNGDVESKFATAHYIAFSGQTNVIPTWTFNFEDRLFYADDHYIAANTKLLYNITGLAAIHAIPSTSYKIGLNTNIMFAFDNNGKAFSTSGRISSGYADDLSMGWDWMQACTEATADGGLGKTLETGKPGKYFGCYVYPYFQKDFQNGYFQTGVEIQYQRFESANTVDGLVYRVPFKFCFWY
ncbi:hypothetical protein MSI_18880 [Treponema sp. JC4]|uniref:hypothetical protein n=1 Tax=Treponema sp. JC4 TaxID=1124982 RepID=UPI00025B0C83|nr:hypothetical protein [Treponema sp. JC4]EID84598.1 hypothetical protein MSI_18880 [Treponema sp. JC4]